MRKGKDGLNKKLKRYLTETDKTEAKIAELQAHLRNVQTLQKQEEDAEIIKSIRRMKLPPKELLELLNGLQEGRLVIAKEEEKRDAEPSETGKKLEFPDLPEKGNEMRDVKERRENQNEMEKTP